MHNPFLKEQPAPKPRNTDSWLMLLLVCVVLFVVVDENKRQDNLVAYSFIVTHERDHLSVAVSKYQEIVDQQSAIINILLEKARTSAGEMLVKDRKQYENHTNDVN